MKSDDSILSWLRKQAQPVAHEKPEAPTFSKVFTKTALDRGCTKEQIDALLNEIHKHNGQE